MSDIPAGARAEAHFQRFLEQYDEYDIGLGMFDERVLRLTDAANEDGGSFSELIEPGIENLNEEWLYHNNVAQVTGRVYLLDSTARPLLESEDSTEQKDQDGHSSFFVENLELRSFGIIDGPHGAMTPDGDATARVGYGFAFVGDTAAFPQLVLYPGEASMHKYDMPTPQAIDLKLHDKWPEQMKLVDKLIVSSDKTVHQLPRRLAVLSRRLGPELAESPEFRQWLSMYANERLNLDQVWPYAVQIAHSLSFQDDDKGENWLDVEFETPTTLYVRKPWIDFVPTKSDSGYSVKASVLAELPDSNDEWGATYVNIPAENIQNIKGTRAFRSLVDRAINGTATSDAAIDTDELENFEDDDTAVAVKRFERNHTGDPQFVEDMKRLSVDINEMITLGAKINEKLYETYEQAITVSRDITETMANCLIGSGIANYRLRFEGEYALRSSVLQERDDSEIASGEYFVKLDATKPFYGLEDGDHFDGTFYSFAPDTIAIYADEDNQNEIVGYRALTRMVVDVSSEPTTMLNYNGIPMVVVDAKRRGLISLDGSASISMPQLDRYTADKEVCTAVSRVYGDDPVVKKVQRLFEALHRENDNSFQDLKKVKYVRSIARTIQNETSDTHAETLRQALESIFLRRPLKITGDIYGADGKVERQRVVYGEVIDVLQSVVGSSVNGPYLAIHDKQAEELVNIRISSATSIAY